MRLFNEVRLEVLHEICLAKSIGELVDHVSCWPAGRDCDVGGQDIVANMNLDCARSEIAVAEANDRGFTHSGKVLDWLYIKINFMSLTRKILPESEDVLIPSAGLSN